MLLYSVLLMDSIPRNVPRDSQVVVSLLKLFLSNSAPIWRVKLAMSVLWKQDKVIEDIMLDFPLNIYLEKKNFRKYWSSKFYKSKSIEYL